MSSNRLLLTLARVVEDRMGVAYLLNEEREPSLPLRPRTRAPVTSTLFAFELSLTTSTYRRLTAFKNLSVRNRRGFEFHPSDKLFVRIRSKLNRSNGGASWDSAEATREVQRIIFGLDIPDDIPLDADIFPRIGSITETSRLFQGALQLGATFNNIGAFSWDVLLDVLENAGYTDFDFLSADLVLQFPLARVVAQNYRGGCTTPHSSSLLQSHFMEVNTGARLRDIMSVSTVNHPLGVWEYSSLCRQRRAQFGRQQANAKADHLQMFKGLYYIAYDELPPGPPMCGPLSLILALSLYRRRTDSSTEARDLCQMYCTRPLELLQDVTETLAQKSIPLEDTQSLRFLRTFLHSIDPTCHFMVFDYSRKPLYWQYSMQCMDPSLNVAPDKTYEEGELTLDFIEKLQKCTVALFYDHTTAHFFPIYDLTVFFSKPNPLAKPARKRHKTAHDFVSSAMENAPLEESALHSAVETRYALCYGCHVLVNRVNSRLAEHRCDRFSCKLCGKTFKNRSDLARHTHISPNNAWTCRQCGSVCKTKTCLERHRSRCVDKTRYVTCVFCNEHQKTLRDHRCESYKCYTCGKQQRDVFVLTHPDHPQGYLKTHSCSFPRLSAKSLGAGTACFAFDFESMLYTDETLKFPFYTEEQEALYAANGLLPTRYPVYIHIVNCASVCKVPGSLDDTVAEDTMQTRYTLREFWATLCEMTARYKVSYCFAHNMRGYDGRLLMDYLETLDVAPVSFIETGSKFMEIVYKHPTNPSGKIVFRDSLNHIQARLKDLPAMFGLDTALVAKGYFPYLFNTAENQFYSGPIPDRSWFNVDAMNEHEKSAFEEWYVSKQSSTYHMREEITYYCENDVLVLAKSLAAYEKVCLEYTPISPLGLVTIASYVFRLYMTSYMPEKTIYYLDESYESFARRALCGGNTNANCLYFNTHTTPNIKGLRYFDIVSLYPTVQFFDPLPTGQPKTVFYCEARSAAFLQNGIHGFFGFLELDVDIVEYVHHPILPYRHEGRMLMTNFNHRRITITSAECQYILRHPAYKILRVYRTDEYVPSTSLFKDYIRTWMRLKIISGKKPRDLDRFLQQTEEHMGIKIVESDFCYNPALRSLAKLILNSLWGKFGERGNKKQAQVLSTGAARTDFYKRAREGTLRDVVLSDFGNTHSVARFKQVFERQKKNVAIAAFVTAHARLRFQQKCDSFGLYKYYGDTDSVIVADVDDAAFAMDKLITPGYLLGDWEAELGDCLIEEYVALAPKTYAFRYRDGDGVLKEKVKAKGFSQNEQTKHTLSFDSFKTLLFSAIRPDLVDGEAKASVSVKTLAFKHVSQSGAMITHDFDKTLQFAYGKGYVDPATFLTYPFGSKRFFPPEVTRRWKVFNEVRGDNGGDVVTHTRYVQTSGVFART